MILREKEKAEVLRIKFPSRFMTSHVAANASFWQTFVLLRHLVSCGLASLALLFLVGCQTSRTPFYPIGIFWDQSTNELPVLRDAGFNLVNGTANRAFLDAASRSSLRVLASPEASAGKDFSAERVRRTVTEFDSHPALWAWYVIDEPDMVGVSPKDVHDANRFIKNLPGSKPTALVLYQGYQSLHYANLTDILMIDRYPIPWLPLANFPQHVRMARLALGPKKPLIAVIQAFDWSKDSEGLPGERNLRPPTYDELRCMTYCALVQRANGLFYGAWHIAEDPKLWQSLTNVVSEVNDRLPLFQAEHIWWPFKHTFRDWSRRFNKALESSIMPALLRVKKGNAHVPNGDYVLAVNNTEESHVYRFELPRPMAGEMPVLGEGRELTIGGNWVEDEFAPYAIHVYGPFGRKK